MVMVSLETGLPSYWQPLHEMHEGPELEVFGHQYSGTLLRLLNNARGDDFPCLRMNPDTYLLAKKIPLEEGQAKLSMVRDVSATTYSILSPKQLPPHAPSLALSICQLTTSGMSDRTRNAFLL